jgi:leucyl-tRNA synthetase
MYTLFAAPPDRDLDWQDAGVEGVSRFLGKMYRFIANTCGAGRVPHPQRTESSGGGLGWEVSQVSPAARQVARKLHQTIKRITTDFDGRWHFNTSVAALMELLNACTGAPEIFALGGAPAGFVQETQRDLVLLLAPFAPYLAHELWEMLGYQSNLLKEPWPKFDAALAREDEVEVVVQINGKIKSRIVVAADSPDETLRDRALADDKIRASLDGRQVVKAIIVPNKLVNLVVR